MAPGQGQRSSSGASEEGVGEAHQGGGTAWEGQRGMEAQSRAGGLEGQEGCSRRSLGCTFRDLGSHTVELPSNSWVFGVDMTLQHSRTSGDNTAGGTRHCEKDSGRDRGVSSPKSLKLLFIFSNEITFTF